MKKPLVPLRRNPLHPKKLLNSKWTAVEPVRREKHFLVTAVCDDESDHPGTCILQAVHSGREREVAWRNLQDARVWRIGWV